LTHDGKVRTSLLRKRFGWQETLSLTYQHQTYGVGVDSGTSKLLTPGISYTRTHSDSKSFPLHGYKAQVDLQGSHQGFLANASFVQLHVLAKGITSLGKRTRMLVRLEAGHEFTSQFRILPPTLRFFTGGDQTVRGFAYQTIGDLDERGNVIGGPTLAVASVESDYRILEKFGVAVFSDVGSAAKSFSIRGLDQGVGAGLRWLSPVGMVRLDGAFAISRPGAPFRIHVSIGADL
jgi:translocation and assembly module TamA